jgi:NAD(P)-dependent dehydrogenase (short-subunit alcohol dehydrogenase family)
VNAPVVLITGAAQGIGLQFARAFAASEYSVALTDIDPAVEGAAADLKKPALGLVMDVSDESSVDNAVSIIDGQLGPPAVLINNAALFTALPFISTLDVDVNTWDRVMAINLRGPFLCIRRVVPGMMAAGFGRVINISSTTALTGGRGRPHYAASKAGVIGLTRALAKEMGPEGITVNAIAPGGTESDNVRAKYTAEWLQSTVAGRAIGRAQLPEDLVGAALFLASPQASMITGQTIVVDGGSSFL